MVIFMAIKTYKKRSAQKLSENFSVKEFCCKGNGCCSTVKIDMKLVELLQKIREHFGAAVTINSGYRCLKHNGATKNASKTSMHTKGQAADIVVEGVKPAEVAKYAESIGVLGIGLYETAKDGYFVHIDTRTKKSFWYGQAQVKRSTFGGNMKKFEIKDWQKAAIKDGYKFKSGADGIWGVECEEVAKKAICKRCYWPWKNKELTKVVQSAVGVEPDGKFGADTKAAVIKWQKLMGLNVTGIVEYNTWKKILGVK